MFLPGPRNLSALTWKHGTRACAQLLALATRCGFCTSPGHGLSNNSRQPLMPSRAHASRPRCHNYSTDQAFAVSSQQQVFGGAADRFGLATAPAVMRSSSWHETNNSSKSTTSNFRIKMCKFNLGKKCIWLKLKQVRHGSVAISFGFDKKSTSEFTFFESLSVTYYLRVACCRQATFSGCWFCSCHCRHQLLELS